MNQWKVFLLQEMLIVFYVWALRKLFVAGARRRGDRPPTKKNVNVMGGYIWSIWGDKEFFVF